MIFVKMIFISWAFWILIAKEINMTKSQAIGKADQTKEVPAKYSESNEFNHERNQVTKAQKQMASQETTGVLDQA